MATVLLNGVVADGSSATVVTSGFGPMRLRVWSDVDGTAVVTAEAKGDTPPWFTANQPWFGLAAVTNPTAAGDYMAIPTVGRLRVTVSGWAVGKIYAILETFSDRDTRYIP